MDADEPQMEAAMESPEQVMDPEMEMDMAGMMSEDHEGSPDKLEGEESPERVEMDPGMDMEDENAEMEAEAQQEVFDYSNDTSKYIGQLPPSFLTQRQLSFFMLFF